MDEKTELVFKKKIQWFQLSVDTRVVYEKLLKIKEGDTISYKELSDVIGRDVQNEARSTLNSARRKALHENRIIFGPIIGWGLKRLTDKEKIDVGESVVGHIRRTSRNGIKKLLCVNNFDDLSNAEKIKHNTHLSILGVFNSFTKSKNIKRLETKIEQTQSKLSFVKTLEMFVNDNAKNAN